jgi:phenylalanyl-tRNA synthetase beta chain
MKISEQWLREWVSPRLDARALAERLTMAGLEVGSVTAAAPPLDHVVVGEIVKMAPHPTAERLHICAVSVGKGKVLTIVCGAENARVGMRAPVALAGAKLPNDVEIKHTDVRGVASAGMLCSAQELGLEEKSDGLLDLGVEAKPGVAIIDTLALDDSILEVELTPNRGDCLSLRGLAREVATLTGAKLTGPRWRAVKAKSRRRVDVKLDAASDCPHYVGRVIEGINPNAVTPLWMRERLRRAGQRPIHPVVDVTNYVMFELGQPMHSFDLDKLHGKIIVRHAKNKEAVALLDGSSVEAEKGTLLIADASGPVALAGVMGGHDSAVSTGTHNIFLESAFFRPEAIAGRARTLGKQSESSHRFERGVDPALQSTAIERATELLLAIVGGKPGPITERSAKNYLPSVKPIVLREPRMELLLGIKLSPKTITTILTRLGMRLVRSGKGFRVTPPSWRFDIRREVDLIEELARVHGYDRIPSVRPRIEMTAPAAPEGQVSQLRLRTALVDRDYQEVITYSFVDPKLQALLDPGTVPLLLANPISADMAAMRTTLWPGLIQAVLYNQNRQQPRVRLFEIGRRFIQNGAELNQEPCIAGVLTGSAFSEQWGIAAREADFHDAKADIEALLTLTGRRDAVRYRPLAHPVLHPGKSAELVLDGQRIGTLGTLHPQIQTKLGLDRELVVFELSLETLTMARIPAFREVSRFPALRRDLAIVVADGLPAQSVLDCVKKVAGKLLINLELFDEYRGKGIDSGRKSLALGLTLQDSSRTLKEAEVDTVVSGVITALQTELGAQLRG